MNGGLGPFFDGLQAETDIDQFVQERREEDLYLEFKEKADASHGNIDDPDRLNFSKTVGAFANSDGGVLFFGIATTKSQDSADRAAALKPISSVESFRAKLLDSILNTTQPPVDGVRVETVLNPSGAGYIKCLIPASDRPPHRSMHAAREYWRRTSNGCRRMEHYELEEVFGRRLRPVLRLKLELRPEPEPSRRDELHFSFLNEGRGIAKHAGFLCTLGSGRIVSYWGGGISNVSSVNGGTPTIQYDAGQSVLHANGILLSVGHASLQRDDRGQALPVSVRWYAENAETRKESAALALGEPVFLT